MRGGAALCGDGVDAGPGGEEDADDGGVAAEDGRVQGSRVKEPVAANQGTLCFVPSVAMFVKHS